MALLNQVSVTYEDEEQPGTVPGHNFIHPDQVCELWNTYSKSDKFNDKVVIDDKIVSHKFSKYELLKSMLLRLNNRYTEDELDLMTDSIGHSPVFLDQSEKTYSKKVKVKMNFA